mmetsp:Transcript_12513/g.10590  ORF Transcript_12513/g.10590 Transcript_12513/m.10590 type:complete len:145 (-) Transcript_12513:474-908(-)
MCINTRQIRTQTLLPMRTSCFLRTNQIFWPSSHFVPPAFLSLIFCSTTTLLPATHAARDSHSPSMQISGEVCVYVNTETPLDNNKDTHTHPQSHAPHKVSLMYKQISFCPSSFSDPYPHLPHSLFPTTPLSATHAPLGSPSANV